MQAAVDTSFVPLGLSAKVDDVAARHATLEALFEDLVAPFLTVIPQLAVELVASARTMDVKLPDGPQKILMQKHINSLVDRLEAKDQVKGHR